MTDKYAYLYKHFSDVHSTGTIMILVGSLQQGLCHDLKLGELEGVFVCNESFDKWVSHQGDPLCRRDEMNLFEKRYHGKFVPFDKKD
jgi:hypothetical protein